MIYFIIFIFKILENTLSTLRIILISNGKKVLGSILLMLTSIVWLTSSSIAIVNLNIIMIIIFSVGSLVGSYIGSIIEEKMALGNNLIICISSKNIADSLRSKGYIITKLIGEGINNNKEVLFIIIKRKKNKNLINCIKSIDENALITSEYTNILYK